MKKEKTMHELAKEFPNKTYRELEKYRDADRQEEAAQIPMTESQKSQEELEPIKKGACVIGEARKDREEINWKTKCKELGMNGYEHIHKTCNSQKMVQHMLRIYEKTG